MIYLNERDAAKLLGVKPNVVSNWIARGQIFPDKFCECGRHAPLFAEDNLQVTRMIRRGWKRDLGLILSESHLVKENLMCQPPGDQDDQWMARFKHDLNSAKLFYKSETQKDKQEARS